MSRPRAKALPSPTAATSAVALMLPIPGTIVSRRLALDQPCPGHKLFVEGRDPVVENPPLLSELGNQPPNPGNRPPPALLGQPSTLRFSPLWKWYKIVQS